MLQEELLVFLQMNWSIDFMKILKSKKIELKGWSKSMLTVNVHSNQQSIIKVQLKQEEQQKEELLKKEIELMSPNSLKRKMLSLKIQIVLLSLIWKLKSKVMQSTWIIWQKNLSKSLSQQNSPMSKIAISDHQLIPFQML